MVILSSAIAAGGVAWIDYLTGIEISFSIFYLIPIAMLTWFSGVRDGLLGAGLCTIVWFSMDRLGGHSYAHWAIPIWNAVVRGGFFIIGVLALKMIRGAYEHERSVSKIKSEMIAVVSHEFGNAVAVAKLATDMLKSAEEEGRPEKRRALYAVLERGQSDLGRVVANFLNLARLESGRFSLQSDDVTLRVVMQNAVTAIKPLADHKRLDFHAEFPEQPVVVRADPNALALIMSNLLGNAVKYTPVGGRISVGISTDAARGAAPGEAVIWVQDTGIGISAADIQDITSGFFRTQEARQTAAGYGVGLKITKELIEAHGGELKLESERGKGTRAWFRLKTTSRP